MSEMSTDPDSETVVPDTVWVPSTSLQLSYCKHCPSVPEGFLLVKSLPSWELMLLGVVLSQRWMKLRGSKPHFPALWVG